MVTYYRDSPWCGYENVFGEDAKEEKEEEKERKERRRGEEEFDLSSKYEFLI